SEEERDALAAEVRAALLAGEEGQQTLAELAGAGRATGMLDLGWIERGDLEPALERGIWDLEPGAVSEPIAARGGRHVVEILAEEEARLQPFADVQDVIRNQLREGRYEEELSNMLAELEESSYVVLNLPPEAAGFRVAGSRENRDELSGFVLAPEEEPQTDSEDAPEDVSEPESGASEPPE
ncbi:MAG: peptidylprolyl isomerase, partial [Thermoanaerobaculia bacterium]